MELKLAERMRGWARRIKRDGLTLWFACKNPGTPWHAKALAWFVVAYALSPIDLVPDFIPVLGYLDDVIMLPVLIWLTVRMLPQPVLLLSRLEAEEWMRTEAARPRSRLGLFLVLGIWLALAWMAWRYLAN
jgi:uncharacterized membrane protein YkvA (DUF1232 family)